MSETPHADPAKHPVEVGFEVPGSDLTTAIRRAFPWVLLTRSLGLSFDLNKIAIAVAGLFVLQLAWSFLDSTLLDLETTKSVASLSVEARWRNALPAFPFSWVTGPLERLIEPIRVLVVPLLTFVSVHPLDAIGVHAGLAGLAAIATWGIAGGAIARIALVQVGWGRGLGAKSAIRYAAAHARPLVATPLLPIVVLIITAIFCGIFGLIYRIPWFGEFLGGLFLLVPISLGLLMLVMVAGLASSWPLMVASVAAEGEDELDAVSRSFSYVNHRLVSYLFYGGIALLIGIPGSWLVDLVANGTLLMAQWGLGLTIPHYTVGQIVTSTSSLLRPVDLSTATPTGQNSWSDVLPTFWIGCVRLSARAWAFSYFWTSISLIYLIIRKDVDGAEWSQLKPDPIDKDSLLDAFESKDVTRSTQSTLAESPLPIPISEDSESA